MRATAVSLALLSSVAYQALADTWTLNISYVGEDFLDDWTFETIADPTDGRVTYVDQATALADNLTYVTSDTLIMRCDDTTVLTADDPGRNSVRIKSNDQFNYHVVVIEGVNGVTPNLISVHVGDTCSLPSDVDETGTQVSTNCDVETDDNSGCGVNNPTDDSFGADFNSAGGGWYAMQRTADSVTVWFWSRTDTTVPDDVSTAASTIDTDNWGTPVALFPDTDCDIDDVFGANNIIFDLTLCGDWAGVDSIYEAAGCSGTCEDFVNENPTAFTDAYWDVAGVYVYTS